MRWTKDDRDEHGLLTPMALALDALDNLGCDCGTDEPGACLYCCVMRALGWIEQEEYREEAAFWCSANLGPTNRISIVDPHDRIDDLEKRVAVLEEHIHRCLHGWDIMRDVIESNTTTEVLISKDKP